MKLFLIKCYNEADYPSSGTSFSELVLANDLVEAISLVKPHVDQVWESEAHEVDLHKIQRMRKARILS